jgi:preprotein translocase subunit SecD
MTRGTLYKALFIIALIVFAVMLILPTVGEKTMVVTLKESPPENVVQEIRSRFDQDFYSVTREDGRVLVRGRNLTDADMNEMRMIQGVDDAELQQHWAEEHLMAKKINLGLDLQGGMHLVMRANFEKIEEKMGKTLNEKERYEITQQALELLRNRIDKFGVSEPSIRPRGNEAIEIQLPGVRDPQAVKKTIGTTGRVEYHLVDEKLSQAAIQWLAENNEGTIPEDPEEAEKLRKQMAEGINLPEDRVLLYYYGRKGDTKQIIPENPIVLVKDVALAGSDINKAWVGQDEYGSLSVQFSLTAEGASKFAEVTSDKNRGRRLAIVIDDKVRSAPQINEQIATGQASITGDFTQEEVLTLARIIKEGALPVDLKIIEERTVGPSLGKDSIQSGLKAIMIGMGGVMIFMVLFYKLAGIISVFGLVLNMVFMLALLSWLGFTLTLPGIAGFILTVGMAVDANVIIYERIKEELKEGKSVRMSITHGFERAFWTIFDANGTTIIAALILSQFGTGPIKGFAVTLLIGVISSMFVALYITRFIYELISLNKKLKKLSI